jgi:hypothetical protein
MCINYGLRAWKLESDMGDANVSLRIVNKKTRNGLCISLLCRSTNKMLYNYQIWELLLNHRFYCS